MAGLCVIEPGLNRDIIKPKGDATSQSQSFVILFPVLDAVLLLFLFHKLNITASPHPRYLCSNAVNTIRRSKFSFDLLL
jgi:hypothetical protein